MKGIDTNVLIRFLVNDDKVQSRKAAHYLKTQCTETAPGFITAIVLCELVWVLQGAYRYPKGLIIGTVRRILTTTELIVENHEAAFKALDAFAEGKADFSDYYIAHIGQRYHVDKTVTFDKKAGEYPLFDLL